MNLRDYYNQQQLMILTGLDHREKIKRWLAKMARQGTPIHREYLARTPFYLRKDVDDYLNRTAVDNPLIKWDVAAKRFNMQLPDIDTDVWIPFSEALKIWPWSHEWLYKQTRTHTSLVNIRTKWLKHDGHTTERLLFYKPDILNFIKRMQ